MSKHRNIRRKKDKSLQLSAKLPPAELKPAWIYDIATMYARGFPLERIADFYDLPSEQILQWIDEAKKGNPEYAQLKKALALAARKYESELLETFQDIALGRTTTKTTKTIRDGDGNIIRSEETISENKPDAESIKYLLSLKSDTYKKADSKSSDTQVNNMQQVQVNIIDNGRPVVVDD